MRALMRHGRTLVALVLLIALLPAPSAAQEGDSDVSDEDVATITTSPDDFAVPLDFAASADAGPALSPIIETTASMIGVRWTGAQPIGLELRSRNGEDWSDWVVVEPIDAAPDGADHPDASDPIWVGADATAIQFRAPGGLSEAEAVLIGASAPTESTDAGLETTTSTETTENGVTVNLRATWDDGCRNPEAEVGYSHVKIAVVHHTTGSNTYGTDEVDDLIRGICHYHVDALGWDDIAYNFLVDRFGQVWEGRTGGIRLPVRGAHSQGFNTWSAGFALLGEHGSSQPTSAALDSLARVVGWKLWLEGRPAIGTTEVESLGSALWSEGTVVTLNRVSGHRNVQSTTCPGDAAYDDLGAIRIDAAAEIASLPKRKGSVGGDFNGDGRIDGATLRGDASWSVSLGDWNEVEAPVEWGDSSKASGWEAHLAGDFDGDGNDDLATYEESTGRWEVLESTGTAFNRSVWDTYDFSWGWSHHLVGDFNGDGDDDIVSYKPRTGNLTVAVSTGSGFTSSQWASLDWPEGWTEHIVGDFNGDGLDDVAHYKPIRRRWKVSLSTGDGFTTKTWTTFGVVRTWKQQQVGDFNGDGLDDIGQFAPSNGTWKISISNGTKFTNSTWTNFQINKGWNRFVVADFTGDGLDDIAQYHSDDRRWVVSKSQGDTFTRSEWFDNVPKPMPYGVAGFLSKNGLEDFVLTRPDGTWWGHASTGDSFNIWLPSGS